MRKTIWTTVQNIVRQRNNHGLLLVNKTNVPSPWYTLCLLYYPQTGTLVQPSVTFLFVPHNKIPHTEKEALVVSEILQLILKSAGIPVVKSYTSLGKRIVNLYTVALDLKKTPVHKRGPTYIKRRESYGETLNKLFDIALCQCDDISNCCCSKLATIPRIERDFMKDQRTARMMINGTTLVIPLLPPWPPQYCKIHSVPLVSLTAARRERDLGRNYEQKLI